MRHFAAYKSSSLKEHVSMKICSLSGTKLYTPAITAEKPPTLGLFCRAKTSI